MPVIKLPNPALLPKDAVVLDLGDLHRQGELILSQARERAAQILSQAQAERQNLISTASAEGRAAGHAQGLAAGRAEGVAQGRAQGLAEQRELIAKLAAAWTDALERFLVHRERLMAEGRQEVVRLAVAMAQRIVKREITLDPTIVAEQLGAVLELITRPSRLVVAIHPLDRPIIETALPELLRNAPGGAGRHVELLDDARLQRGSCVANLGEAAAPGSAGAPSSAGLGGRIDASIATQLDRMVEALLPGEGREPDESEAPAEPPAARGVGSSAAAARHAEVAGPAAPASRSPAPESTLPPPVSPPEPQAIDRPEVVSPPPPAGPASPPADAAPPPEAPPSSESGEASS